MHVHISQDDGVPIYLQIANQVKYLIGSGALVSGDEMPTIRALAEQLVINPNTVARAYRELQVEGYLEKRGTAGTYVSAIASPMNKEVQIRKLEQRIDALLADAEHMNISLDEVKQLLDSRHKTLKGDS